MNFATKEHLWYSFTKILYKKVEQNLLVEEYNINKINK